MENLVSVDTDFWRGRSVFVTGHTGFKGGWLSLWLHQRGARVHGYALDPPTEPALFEVARVGEVLASDTRADVSNVAELEAALTRAQPEVVFHLAAQPLVRPSYDDPLGTFATNVMGTAHVLQAARAVDAIRAVVVVTTDKVYENRDGLHRYREVDPLGGDDPYSASKAAAEMVVASYRASFFRAAAGHPVHVATARAGNVVGGGDWGRDRLVPDCLRAFAAGDTVTLRCPASVRPWQHVLEALSGYQRLAELLLGAQGARFARAWNFGPDPSDDAEVGKVADLTASLWGSRARVEHAPMADQVHESKWLRLDSSSAREELRWRPRWSLEQALAHTVAWQRGWKQGADMAALSLEQIRNYEMAPTS